MSASSQLEVTVIVYLPALPQPLSFTSPAIANEEMWGSPEGTRISTKKVNSA